MGFVRLLLFAGLLAFAITQYRSIRRRAHADLAGAPPPPKRRKAAAKEPLDWRTGMASEIADDAVTALLYADIPGATDVSNEIVAPRWTIIDGTIVSVFDHRRQWRIGGTDHKRALSCARIDTAASLPHLVLRAKDANDGAWSDLHSFPSDAANLTRAFDVLTAEDECANLLLDETLIDYVLAEPRLRLLAAQGSEVIVAFDALHVYLGMQTASSAGDRGEELARFAVGLESRIPSVVRVRYPR